MSSDIDYLIALAKEHTETELITDVERFILDYNIQASPTIDRRVPYELIYLEYLKWKIENNNTLVTTKHKFISQLSKFFEKSRDPFTRYFNVYSDKIIVNKQTKSEAVLDSLQEKEYWKWLETKQEVMARLNKKKKELKKGTKRKTKVLKKGSSLK